LFVALKTKEEELKGCQKRRDSVEKEQSEPRFAIIQAEKECESSAKQLEACERIGEEKGNTGTELTSAVDGTDVNNYELKDLGPNMSEEMSFEAQCNTGECGAPH
jgi:chromosome segregation ATPase